MICSVCNKNTAVVFLNKIENGKKTVEGLCYNCAKEKGISVENTTSTSNNVNNMGNINLDQMASQFGVIFKDLTNSLNNGEFDNRRQNKNYAPSYILISGIHR